MAEAAFNRRVIIYFTIMSFLHEFYAVFGAVTLYSIELFRRYLFGSITAIINLDIRRVGLEKRATMGAAIIHIDPFYCLQYVLGWWRQLGMHSKFAIVERRAAPLLLGDALQASHEFSECTSLVTIKSLLFAGSVGRDVGRKR